jgi:putative ABC transport system substrate-binding protein
MYGDAPMRRRRFLTALGSAAVFTPVVARAQQLKVPIVAMLTDDPSVKVGGVDALQGKLRELGWVDGSTMHFELRVSKAQDRSTHATELVKLAPDVLVSLGTVHTEALAERTQHIPIVFINASDPLRSGFSDSLAKPSRNLTGFTVFDPAMGGKALQLLKDLKPNIYNVTWIANSEAAADQHVANAFRTRTEQFAKDLNIDLKWAEVRSATEIETIIKGTDSGEGLIVNPDQFLSSNSRLVIDLAAGQKVPALYFWAGYVTNGGLMAYTSDYYVPFRNAAGYVDRLLRGTRVDQLPIQMPTTFDLHINLGTARSLGLEIPRELLVQARRIVE